MEVCVLRSYRWDVSTYWRAAPTQQACSSLCCVNSEYFKLVLKRKPEYILAKAFCPRQGSAGDCARSLEPDSLWVQILALALRTCVTWQILKPSISGPQSVKWSRGYRAHG